MVQAHDSKSVPSSAQLGFAACPSAACRGGGGVPGPSPKPGDASPASPEVVSLWRRGPPTLSESLRGPVSRLPRRASLEGLALRSSPAVLTPLETLRRGGRPHGRPRRLTPVLRAPGPSGVAHHVVGMCGEDAGTQQPEPHRDQFNHHVDPIHRTQPTLRSRNVMAARTVNESCKRARIPQPTATFVQRSRPRVRRIGTAPRPIAAPPWQLSDGIGAAERRAQLSPARARIVVNAFGLVSPFGQWPTARDTSRRCAAAAW